ncbi:MAG: DUF4920 domain-containing protein [Daejeonella sp.]
MKIKLLLLVAIAFLASCTTKPKTELKAVENIKGTAVYGDSVKNDNVIDLAAIPTAMKNESKMNMKVKGRINEVFTDKSCWMIMKLSNGENMRITFKDYNLFVPKTIKGKEVILDGFAYSDTTSVEDQQHYAQEAGKTDAEIAKITTPKIQLAFQASGLVVLK